MHDDLRCVKGIINGILFSIPLWAIIIFIANKLVH